eukprot:gnl/MRDRNA2_/MRDRNA2_75023_c0_seq1.p1 gnl/MRDRNA2_/MRDRNA2_75023_c0~~gnl/MRDRNA2_/MRDRNA2_75023_c0_seq1.p1  ORF type:complete len:324 (-),score=57.21 gnl/MRDRNA2_/MRDRNA2_75023_c0_seq1:51-1022(-)
MLPSIDGPTTPRQMWCGDGGNPTNANFFASQEEKEAIHNARHRYPRKAKSKQSEVFEVGVGLVKEEKITRRIMGFGLGFEKIFATTSMKLPVSAYTIFVEFQPLDTEELFSRCFNGLHTVYDLKKWVFEVSGVPMNAYELTYAEPGKATLTDQLRLLTTQESLDTRTLAVTRAVHRLYKGIPGVHSIDDTGVTRLYLRLKCRRSGRLLNNLHTSLLFKTSPQDAQGGDPQGPQNQQLSANLSSGAVDHPAEAELGLYAPGGEKGGLFDTRGYEMFSKARIHGASSEIARIYISTDQEPSKKLKLAKNVLTKNNPIPSKAISYW